MKNRTLIGIICMVLSVAITFLVSPLVTKLSVDTVSVCTVTGNLKQGIQITESDITIIKAKKDSIPHGAIVEKNKIVGKYTVSNLYAGDFYTASKLTDEANTASDVFASLDGNQVAMSFTIDTFAAGLSGKLMNGDIISIIVKDKDTKKTTIPGALTYIRVITTTTSGGIDKESVVENEDGSYELPSTVTVLVSSEQAKLLADYEENATMQIALVYRGEKETAQKFLDKQSEYLRKGVQDSDGRNEWIYEESGIEIESAENDENGGIEVSGN